MQTMDNESCLVNSDSFINALEYLKKQYQLDHKVGFLSNKVRKSDHLTVSESIAYLEELDFGVELTTVEGLEVLELDQEHLLFCFDHEHDIIILRHNSDFNRTRSKYSLEHPVLVISSQALKPRQSIEGPHHKDLRWFLGKLTEKDGLYLVLTGLITNLLMYVVPIYNMNVFDKVLPNGFLGILSSLALIAVFLVVIWFINRSALSYLLSDRIFNLERKLSDEFTRRLCNLKPSAMPYTASFMTQLVTYGRSLSQMIGLLHLMAMVDLPFLILSLVLIGVFGGPLVAIPLLATALVIGLNLFLQPKIQQYIQSQYEFQGRKRKFEYEIMQSLPFIKMAGMERYFTDCIQHNRPDHRQYFSISAHINHVSLLILYLSLIAVTGLGAYRISEGLMTMGQLVACSLLAAKAISNASITTLLFNVNRIKTLFDNLNRFYEIPVEESGAAFCLTRIKHLELKEIQFSYPENKHFNMKGINIDLNLPDSLYIYGKPGSGKSSLFNILAGLKDPLGGQILVNNLNIEHFDYRDVRNHVHFSSSYYRFFTGTLHDNLALGRSSITADQIAEALEKVQLTEKINQLDEGLQYRVDNAEVIPLSSSERKRFMLARIFLTDADLVVLDEPFEFLSDENSLYFIQTIQAYCKETKKGLIIFSNRKAFAHLCGDALMLNNGQLYPMKTEK